jgi:hypothetical protein
MLMAKKPTKGQKIVKGTMDEWKAGTLHSGKGASVVKDQKQAIAIALSKKAKTAKGKTKKTKK